MLGEAGGGGNVLWLASLDLPLLLRALAVDLYVDARAVSDGGGVGHNSKGPISAA